MSDKIPTYVADGFIGSGDIRELTFSAFSNVPNAGTLPKDGSGPAFALITLAIPGLTFSAGPFGSPANRLVYFGGSTGKVQVSGGSGFNYVVVANYSFVADANVD